jgi:hypothetical protein
MPALAAMLDAKVQRVRDALSGLSMNTINFVQLCITRHDCAGIGKTKNGQKRTKAEKSDRNGNAVCTFTVRLFALIKKVLVMMERNDIIIKPYTHQELAMLYCVSWRTLQRWLKPHLPAIGEKNGHYYTTRQVKTIFSRIGWPPGSSAANWRKVA